MLTVKQIEAAKPKEKPYRLLDGNGLYLYVPVSGKKVWQLRYKIDGKEKILTVGKYPLMTLQEARDKAWTARKDISVGIDPVQAKKASSNNNSFSEKRRKPSPNAGGDIRRKARRALKINQVLTDSERRL
ncbi:DUF4102 domain-containing protein [Escherichia coli]|nr:DUF4102 domain-containing protein [Escherichia coli]PAZ58319.1 integrase [Escherichia coli]PAZ64337.1 integrase [Escherichia coli]PAZ84812.1 integrase [Escherichia coli]